MVVGHKHIMTNKYTWNNGSLHFENSFDESLEPYYNIMYQSSKIILPHNCRWPVLLFPNTICLEMYNVSCPIVLTHNIQRLNIRAFYMFEHIKLPSGLVSLYIYNSAYHLELNKYIYELSINDTYEYSLRLNKTMYQINISYHFNSLLVLNKKLDAVEVGSSFNQLLELPKYLSRLTIGYNFDKKILLPTYIIYLSIECKSTKNIILDGNIAGQLTIYNHTSDCVLTDNLPDKKERIILISRTRCSTNNLPKNLIMQNHFYKTK